MKGDAESTIGPVPNWWQCVVIGAVALVCFVLGVALTILVYCIVVAVYMWPFLFYPRFHRKHHLWTWELWHGIRIPNYYEFRRLTKEEIAKGWEDMDKVDNGEYDKWWPPRRGKR